MIIYSYPARQLCKMVRHKCHHPVLFHWVLHKQQIMCSKLNQQFTQVSNHKTAKNTFWSSVKKAFFWVKFFLQAALCWENWNYMKCLLILSKGFFWSLVKKKKPRTPATNTKLNSSTIFLCTCNFLFVNFKSQHTMLIFCIYIYL